ncbi:hypothetical protein YC2023_080748 [Brassica napus]
MQVRHISEIGHTLEIEFNMDYIPTTITKMSIEMQSHQAEAAPAEEPLSQWLINMPEPPTMWQEFVGYIRTNVLSKKRNKMKKKPSNQVYSYLKSVFPILIWGRQYKLNMFKKDLMAGLTLASLCIPQSIGYANLAGLDPEYGLCKSKFSTQTCIWQPLNFVIGSSFLIFILLARFLGKRNKKLFWIPAMAPLISVILATLIVYLTNADTRGVKIVKTIKPGFNRPSVNQLEFNGPHLGQVAKIGIICAIIALTEAIAVGRSFATIKGYRLDGNKEMMAMGFSNIAGSLTSCYVATGSFSRTAVNFSAGCETVVSNIVMAITVMVSLEVLTRFLYFTPTAILASIILSALPGLIDISGALHIWKLDKLDFLVLVAAFLGVLFASVEIGLLLAVGISFTRIILSSIRPTVEALGRLSKTDIFGDINQYPMATKTQGLLTLRISSPLILNSIQKVEEEEDDEQEIKRAKVLQVVILDMSCVMGLDTSGVVALEELHQELASNDTHVHYDNLSIKKS